MAFKLRTAKDPLSDGSDVYAVVLTDADGAYMVFDAISQDSANRLLVGMQALLNEHTNDGADIN